MDITLEKIELVKDRTGVSYKEAKDALEASDGSVVDAIISIEETIDMSGSTKVGQKGADIVGYIKELIKQGNVSKIVVKKDGEKVLNFPVNVTIVGTVLAPWAAIAGVIAAFGTKCQIELVKDDGSIVDITEKANDTFDDVVEKGSDVAGDIKDKGQDIFSNVKNKTTDIFSKTKDTAEDSFEEFKEKYQDVKDTAEQGAQNVKDEMYDVKDEFKDVKDAAVEAGKDVKSDAKDAACDMKNDAKVKVENLKDDIKD